MSHLELDENVDIAVGSEIVTQDRPEESQAPDVVAATKVLEILLVDRNSHAHGLRISPRR